MRFWINSWAPFIWPAIFWHRRSRSASFSTSVKNVRTCGKDQSGKYWNSRMAGLFVHRSLTHLGHIVIIRAVVSAHIRRHLTLRLHEARLGIRSTEAVGEVVRSSPYRTGQKLLNISIQISLSHNKFYKCLTAFGSHALIHHSRQMLRC